MRTTQRQRFEKRFQLWRGVFRFKWPQWVRARRCTNCADDVLEEPMWRFRRNDEHGNWWVYLCATCAPVRESAFQFWIEHERGS